ncbi:MAG: NAD(P)H-hydrate dehydratase [Burkholderiales bacterium]|nr:NAD(P)H-hydrate dehydratase [Burkholderiales bacterium]
MNDTLLRTGDLRRLEREAMARLPAGALMARAADAVADLAATMARTLPRGRAIEVLVGGGNNGGDALLAASRLQARGFAVRCRALFSEAPMAADARAVHARWNAQGGTFHDPAGLAESLAAGPALVIDGLFGIGLSRPLAGLAARLVDSVNRSGAAVLAVDVPSGLDAETGWVVGGAQGIAIRATRTLTFIADKPGLHTGQAASHTGRVEVDGLGVFAGCAVPAPAGAGHLITREAASRLPVARRADAHKGSHGGVLVLGGAPGTRGAAWLAALAAQASGAGKVWLACPGDGASDPTYPQLMTRAFDAPLQAGETLVIGCGLGTSDIALARLNDALASPAACVLDADALNLLAREPALLARLPGQPTARILTPHPLEAARLLGCDTAGVQADRIASAQRLAAICGAVVVLKGAGSVLAHPDGRWAINASGSPALATGGTGDVLAGLLGGLLAQGYDAWTAACLGVWLHGHAGDRWHLAHPQGAGLNPLHLVDLIPAAWPVASETP